MHLYSIDFAINQKGLPVVESSPGTRAWTPLMPCHKPIGGKSLIDPRQFYNATTRHESHLGSSLYVRNNELHQQTPVFWGVIVAFIFKTNPIRRIGQH